ncbi:hypothetical protein DPMN_133928 [Dreissena polymorpha]|uniref:Uncharacterized protein n=1 Tax=Dreissena polymorpha TaxID=45954 RepID=A0A9D4JEF4_DREPO|nr:hypothetical protein DPMN_133928 [Dreissena polymorpha]
MMVVASDESPLQRRASPIQLPQPSRVSLTTGELVDCLGSLTGKSEIISIKQGNQGCVRNRKKYNNCSFHSIFFTFEGYHSY